MDNNNKNMSNLERTLKHHLDRRRASSTLRNLTVSPSSAVDFSSNDFLSLSTSPALRAAYLQELQRDSSFRIGSGGSRLLDGNSEYAEVLERDIAAFHNAPAGLLCNSGFDANAGIFACIPQPNDVVVYDAFIHASVHDGMRLSRAKRIAFEHNSVEDLQKVLEGCVAGDDSIRRGRRNVFVAVEAVYSMDGDLSPLKAIVEVVERLLPQRNGHVIVDEAHSTGALGSRGRGLVCELGLEGRVFARLHTFGKALACNGAIILCSPVVRHYLINYSRPLIYTTFMSYPSLAAIRAAYSLLWDGHTEPLQLHLRSLVEELFSRLQALRARYAGVPDIDHWIQVPSEAPVSPIFAVLTSQPRSLARHCQEGGFVVRAVVPPTVPEGTSRIRICVHAGNTSQQIRRLVDRIDSWLRLHTASDKLMEASPERARL
ncbi:hypothetical protein W97_00009 [Coniosporium apollinis CBS 100218]|uniref:Aminotransferase class I/classII large domain-containing protein n=1 Tax=Coniosporium apollinis (strain CBS 100218) TaxID=1168221 RepID=R7YFY2_CONA1|nr:uncharacterized protein W97_00009 [Coniosporium apollinis CBS 100218]EON60800.1 hypothetical protein W97_00009 [Coniosporium apollinis CBS 100218]